MKNKLTSTPRLAVVGIGNELCADDAVGMRIARTLLSHSTVQTSKTLMVIPAGVAVENVTGQLRGFAPDMILLIDAAELGEAPGTVRWLPMDAVTGVSALTHSLPLTMVMHYLNSELGCPVALLGIQIKSNEMGVEMCSEVHSAAEEILDELNRVFVEN